MAAPTTQEILAAVALTAGNKTAAAAHLGMSRASLRRQLDKMRDLDSMIQVPADFVVKKQSATYDAEGNLKSQSIQTAAAPGDVYAPLPGHRIKGESFLTGPDGKLLAKWTKTREDSIGAGLVEGIQEAFSQYKGMAPFIPAPTVTSDDTLTMYPLADLHVGMYSDARETGDNYDVELAVDLVKRTIGTLVAKSEPSKRAIVLGLGDYFHMNDQKNVTPGSGHRLDVDGRWGRVFSAGAKLMTHVIDLVAQKHETVDVVLLPGNHDEDAAICLRVALSLFYSNNPRIRVYDEPGLHWFDRFGACMFGATHGHTMKPDRMVLMMASERQRDWAETEHRYMKFGHIHHATLKDVAGVQVESHTTPAPKDAWAAGGGYISKRSMCSISYHREFGEWNRSTINILPPKRPSA